MMEMRLRGGRTVFTAISALLALADASHAQGQTAEQERTLQIWAAPGLYGLDRTACNRENGQPASGDTAKIHRELCPLFTAPEARAVYGRNFAKLVGEAFPHVVSNPVGDQTEGVAVARRLSGTLIASLQISRADIWTVDKGADISEVFLPITLTLDLTNAVTGEVMFTESLSVRPTSKFDNKVIFTSSRQQLPAHINATIAELVRNAAARFKPYPLAATVRGAKDGLYVVDKGRKAGLRTGDQIGGDATVVFADANYAVIKPILDSYKPGDTVSRQVAAPAEYLARPNALIVTASVPDGMSGEYITRIFEENLGTTAVLGTMPVNPSFAQLRDLALGKAGFSSQAKNQRSLPDFFIRLQAYAMEPTRLPSKIPGKFFDTFESYAIADVVDRSGRVMFSASVSDRIVDDVVGTMGFSIEQRQDTVVRNALFKLAQRIGLEFKPRNVRLPATGQGNADYALDPGGALAIGTRGVVLRKAGNFAGINDDVLFPVGTYQVADLEAGRGLLQNFDIKTPRLRGGDLFVFDSGAQASQSRRAFAMCPPQQITDSVGDLSNDLLMRALGQSAFNQSFGVPTFLGDIPLLAGSRMAQFPGASDLGALQARPQDICFTPIFRFSGGAMVKADGDQMAGQFQITLGFTLHQAGQKIAGSGTRFEMTSSTMPQSTSTATMSSIARRDFAAQMQKQAVTALKAIAIPK